ncbi:MAG: hypothetical protein Kow00121_05500 [Elainellaceae cyanobacterium]
MAAIMVNVSAQIKSGPQVSFSQEIPAEAYDKVEVVVPPGGQEVSVNVQPGTLAQVSFLLIQSSLYSNPKDAAQKVSYGITATNINLDQPQIFLGTGAVSILGSDPQTLKFKNDYPAEGDAAETNKAVIQILVGRKATA